MNPADESLWERYQHLLHQYIAHGDESRLREIVKLSRERGLTLETTSGRVAASVRAVLSAYASIGAESMVVEIDRRRQSHEELRRTSEPEDCLVELSTPELGGDTVVIEIRGRCPSYDLPLVRLDYVPRSEEEPEAASPLSRPIEPRQLYDVLRGLLAREPERQTER